LNNPAQVTTTTIIKFESFLISAIHSNKVTMWANTVKCREKALGYYFWRLVFQKIYYEVLRGSNYQKEFCISKMFGQ